MSSLMERNDIKKKLSTFSCPFTWQLKDASTYYSETRSYFNDDDDVDEEAYLPLQKLIQCLVIFYEKVLFNENDRIDLKFQECEHYFSEVKEKKQDEDIMRVVEHIFNSTKCYYLFEQNNIEQLQIILPTIIKISDFNKIELAALSGCQSVAWSMYNKYGTKEAINLANQAIEQNSDKALWNFILAVNIRRERRSASCYSPVSNKERLHFSLAFQKSKNPIFGIYNAQMLRELLYKSNSSLLERKRQESLLLELYKKILQLSGSNYRILLKLALGFIRIRYSCQSLLAKYCLDAVKLIQPNNSTYLHYKGIYLEKFGNAREAFKYYEAAANANNQVAERDYLRFGYQQNLLDPLVYLLSQVLKYNKIEDKKRQHLYLQIAICYYERHDCIYALEYFLKAIEENPESKILTEVYTFLNFSTRKYNGGIYIFLKLKFLPDLKIHSKYRYQENTFMKSYNKLQHLCNLHG